MSHTDQAAAGREPRLSRGCAPLGWRRGRRRRAGWSNIAPKNGNISVGPWIRLCPPATTRASSPCSASSPMASRRDCGRWYANGAGINSNSSLVRSRVIGCGPSIFCGSISAFFHITGNENRDPLNRSSGSAALPVTSPHPANVQLVAQEGRGSAWPARQRGAGDTPLRAKELTASKRE